MVTSCGGWRANADGGVFDAVSQAMRRQAELELKVLKQEEAAPHAAPKV